MEEIKSCYNCKNLMRHYMVNRGSIVPLHCGHCTVRKLKAKEIRGFPYREGCKLWEEDNIKKENQKELLLNKLENSIKDIHVIMLALKEMERSKIE